MSGRTNEELEKELALLKKRAELRECLPHLFGLKMYEWQHDFFHSWKKTMLLTAGNQLGKSSIQIRKYIHFCTEPKLWHELFPEQRSSPHFRPVVWYLYPNQQTITQEFFDKWVVEFMPRGAYKNHPQYGWKHQMKHGVVLSVSFNSGAKLYFKSYSQNEADLQASTVSLIGCDEELPENLYSEINARLFGMDGYFSMVFTATLGQNFWRRAMEPNKNETPALPDAWKRRASAYDSMVYVDGTASKWTEERIRANINKCKSEAEVQKRIFGHFVKDDGLMYTGFDRERNVVPFPRKGDKEYRGVPKGWDVISGVDCGSGGEKNHPAAYALIAINQDRTKVRLFRGRRLDGIETTSADILMYYRESRGKIKPISQAYDFSAKDFGTIASRTGESFIKANKDRTFGQDLLNTLLKYGVFKIYACEEHEKLVDEFESLTDSTAKTHAEDDFIDSVRYALASAPINWAEIIEKIEEIGVNLDLYDSVEIHKDLTPREEAYKALKEKERGRHDEEKSIVNDSYRDEIGFWNDLYSA